VVELNWFVNGGGLWLSLLASDFNFAQANVLVLK